MASPTRRPVTEAVVGDYLYIRTGYAVTEKCDIRRITHISTGKRIFLAGNEAAWKDWRKGFDPLQGTAPGLPGVQALGLASSEEVAEFLDRQGALERRRDEVAFWQDYDWRIESRFKMMFEALTTIAAGGDSAVQTARDAISDLNLPEIPEGWVRSVD